MGKNKAGRAFHRLIDLGFIRRRADEPENYNLREANHWILTEFDFGKIAASKEFMSWKSSENLESRPSLGTGCPSSGTISEVTTSKDGKASLIGDGKCAKSQTGVPDERHSYNQSVSAN